MLEHAELYVIRDDQKTGTAQEVKDIIEQNLELLAETEHDEWMRYLRLNGWQYAEKRNDAAKLHDLLVPYEQLSETNKDKDRNQVRNYPQMLTGAGYRIVTWSELASVHKGNRAGLPFADHHVPARLR